MSRVFLSHSCTDHPLPNQLADLLRRAGLEVLIDPFEFGDRTCGIVQEHIKGADHVVVLFTEACTHSRWVLIESIFARLCYDLGAINILPISVNGTAVYEFLDDFICLQWSGRDDLQELADGISQRISRSMSRLTLPTDSYEAEKEKERGRELERKHAATGSIFELHAAVESYDRAIQLDFCNHNAWANKGWSLWKLGERARALDALEVAELLRPDSRHVKDVQARILASGGKLYSQRFRNRSWSARANNHLQQKFYAR